MSSKEKIPIYHKSRPSTQTYVILSEVFFSLIKGLVIFSFMLLMNARASKGPSYSININFSSLSLFLNKMHYDVGL